MSKLQKELLKLQRQDKDDIFLENRTLISELFDKCGKTFKIRINDMLYLANHYDDLGSWTCGMAAYHFTLLDEVKEVDFNEI